MGFGLGPSCVPMALRWSGRSSVATMAPRTEGSAWPHTTGSGVDEYCPVCVVSTTRVMAWCAPLGLVALAPPLPPVAPALPPRQKSSLQHLPPLEMVGCGLPAAPRRVVRTGPNRGERFGSSMEVARAVLSMVAPSPVICLSSVCGMATVSSTSIPASRSTRTLQGGGWEGVEGAGWRVKGAGWRLGGEGYLDLVGGDELVHARDAQPVEHVGRELVEAHLKGEGEGEGGG